MILKTVSCERVIHLVGMYVPPGLVPIRSWGHAWRRLPRGPFFAQIGQWCKEAKWVAWQPTPFSAPRPDGDDPWRSGYSLDSNYTLQGQLSQNQDLLSDPRSRCDLKARSDGEITARSRVRGLIVISRELPSEGVIQPTAILGQPKIVPIRARGPKIAQVAMPIVLIYFAIYF